AHAVALTSAILLPLGGLALLIAQAADGGRLRLRTLRQRFELGLGLALGQLLAALVIGAVVMFVSGHDAWSMIAVLAFAALIAIRAAQLLSRGVVQDVRAIRDGLRAVQRGEREVRVGASSSSELGELADAANRMIATLRTEERHRDTADAARRQLLASVSHDLRTPLTALRLLTEALDDDLVDAATARRYVTTMAANVRALGALIDDLFELSRLDAAEVMWSTDDAVPMAELIGETLAALGPEADARSVALGSEIATGVAPARANPEKLQRVLANLLQNAIRHTPPDGSVLVRARQSNGAVEVEVCDSGDGIPAGERARVFEPFYRGGASKGDARKGDGSKGDGSKGDGSRGDGRRGDGSSDGGESARGGGGRGLGLAIARAIVEAHGGRIWLADAPRGTRICFTVPAAQLAGAVCRTHLSEAPLGDLF
ncbi:MAG: HAMP domain-containing histidine kinase, partial [Solirubrobacterales bacterium]|nr:HAMP domain-containing histidine kinase [Solirubrobacterales bacterium]